MDEQFELDAQPVWRQHQERLQADVACIALNRVQTRYIRNDLDFAFYQTETELLENDRQIAAAVEYAIGLVLQRSAVGGR